MFKQIALSTCVLLGLAASRGQAGPILTLDPANGSVTGSAGSTVGWGFDLPSDPTNSLTIVSSFLTSQTNAALGNYVDLIAGQGGPDGGLVDPGAADWVEPFVFGADPANQTGVGAFLISPLAQAGATDAGFIQIDWELDSASSGCPGCFVSSGAILTPFQVTVGSVAPEPATSGLILVAALAGYAIYRRRAA